VVKRGIDLHGWEITGVKFQPARRRQVRGVKVAAPFLEAPGTSSEPDFLLGQQVQGALQEAECMMRNEDISHPISRI
jgi:hypothetical protein